MLLTRKHDPKGSTPPQTHPVGNMIKRQLKMIHGTALMIGALKGALEDSAMFTQRKHTCYFMNFYQNDKI